jgi:hypothetical protein
MAALCIHISNKYRVSEMATCNPNPYNTSHQVIQTLGMYQRPCVTARAACGARHECPCIYCESRQHLSEECTRPHVRCTGEECKVSPLHMHYEPHHSLCPYFMLHTSGNHMDPQEEACILEDILYLNDYENRTD